MPVQLMLTPEFINKCLVQKKGCSAEQSGLTYSAGFLEPHVNYDKDLASKAKLSEWLVVDGDVAKKVNATGKDSCISSLIRVFPEGLTLRDCEAMIAFAFSTVRDENNPNADRNKFNSGVARFPVSVIDQFFEASGLPVTQSVMRIIINKDDFQLELSQNAHGVAFHYEFTVKKDSDHKYQIFFKNNSGYSFEMEDAVFAKYKEKAINLLNSQKDFDQAEIAFLTTCLVDNEFSKLFAEKAVFFNDKAWDLTQKLIKSAYQENAQAYYKRIQSDIALAEDRKVLKRRLAVAAGIVIGVIGVAWLTMLAIVFYPVLATGISALVLNLLIGGVSLVGALVAPAMIASCFKIQKWSSPRPFNDEKTAVVGSNREMNTVLGGKKVVRAEKGFLSGLSSFFRSSPENIDYREVPRTGKPRPVILYDSSDEECNPGLKKGRKKLN